MGCCHPGLGDPGRDICALLALLCVYPIHLGWAGLLLVQAGWCGLARGQACEVCTPLTGDAPLELTDDCSLALVWKNNERLKEFVLVESKELECVEDPGSASEAARAGHFTLEQCLNLFTKPEVLAPEEAW